MDFTPNKSITPSVILEKSSISHVERLFLGSEANPYLSDNDKTPNYDGIIELLDGQIICGKITVQVKSYPPKYAGLNKFDIPTSLLGYAQRVPTEVVVLLVVDHLNKIVFWKHISNEFINQNKSKATQFTITYNFTKEEILSEINKDETIKQWKAIYNTTAESIVNKTEKINAIIDSYACAFECVNTHFYSIPDSYIERQELSQIYQWIYDAKGNIKESDNICILTGEAGVGKSVIIKQLANKLRTDNLPLLAIKADISNITSNKIIETINEVVNYISSDKNVRAVLLIDQIDALSQSLSNDRAQINAYYSILSKFSSLTYSNLRIIVSCRKFDLNYDPILSNLKTNKNIELGELSIKEVESTLRLLVGNESVSNINDKTKELLQTAQYLDAYCRIYRDNNTILNFSSHHKLYEELWKVKILHPRSEKILPDILEQKMSKIADKIYNDQTLSVKWISSGKDVNYINYLATEGIITCENNTIRFFHQSFYDYVFARKFLSDKESLYSFITSNHQGLFIRSSIKQLLEFLKGYDPDRHFKQISLLLSDTQIRYHIKLLVLQHLGTQAPEKRSIDIILRIKQEDTELFNDFIKLSVAVEWFDALIDELENDIVLIDKIDRYSVLANFLSSFSGLREDKVFALIDKIKNEEVRAQVASKAIWFVQNHSSPAVLKWYYQLYKGKNDFEKLMFLERAITDNPQFVFEEISPILDEVAKCWCKDEELPVDEHRFFDEIIESLSEKHPRDLYPILKNIIVTLIRDTSHSLFNDYLKGNTTFEGYFYRSESRLKIITYLLNILKNELLNNSDFVVKEVDYYLSTDSSTLYAMALEIMLKEPKLFISTTYKLLDNHKLVCYLLNNDREGYYFKELLKHSFQYFNMEQQNRIKQYALSFSCKNEMVANPERRWQRQLYPHIGIRQRAFIYSLPKESLTIALKRRKNELDRRFPWKYKNEKSSDHVTMAHVCGGLVSDEKYKKLSLYNWETSFVKLAGSRRFDLHFDPHVHERKFRECVKDDPGKFYPFVFRIFDDGRIKAYYKLAGIRGLLDARYNVDDLYPLLKRVYDSNPDNETLYDIVETVQLFIKCGSLYSDEVSEILISIIKKEYASSYNIEKESKPSESDDRISGLLTTGINLLQGRAIEAFIENAAFADRREKAYKALIGLVESLGVELKLTVLYRIYHVDVYDEKLFEELLPLCLQSEVSEFVYVASNIINGYLSCKPDVVMPYLKSVENITRAQRGLGILYFLGCCYGNIKCEDVLYSKINQAQDAGFLKGALKAAFTNFSHPLCREHSLSVINQLAKSNDESVVKSFAYKFSKLTCEDFPVIKYALKSHISSRYVCRVKGIIDYLELCAASYPEECFEYLDIIMKKETDAENSIHHKDCLELLFAIYKYLKETTAIQEKIIDTFDFALKKTYGHYGVNEILENVDYNR
ncbi:NACHT domain-containing NTPase [Bacteroides sp. 519]|uniref:NACHT domain-containing protein n=1 Tax=Bacteroides sp. 519 TaxID=2302937 RepID=UPI0013D606E6|nr:ATP-binding protein [Bacteroides sp. 519]NDV56544.1 ATP-binding protein [Bacteroides sp. 519]